MKKRVYLSTIALMAIFLSGCQLMDFGSSKKTKKPETEVFVNTQYEPIEIPTVKSTYQFNTQAEWRTLIEPLINELLATTTQIGEGKTLMVGDVSNQTAERYNMNSFVAEVYSELDNQTIYTLVPEADVINGKNVVGIAMDDTSLSRAKLLGLGRYLESDFILYSVVKENPNSAEDKPILAMELIDSRSGEIVWRFDSTQITR